MTFCADSHSHRIMNPNGFEPVNNTVKLWGFIFGFGLSEISQHLLDRFPWNLLQIFKVHRGWILKTLLILWFFPLAPPVGQSFNFQLFKLKLFSDIAWHVQDGLAQNVVQIFMIPRWWILPLVPRGWHFWFKVKYVGLKFTRWTEPRL